MNPATQNQNSSFDQTVPHTLPKGVVDSDDKIGIIPTTLSPSQLGFFQKWGILFTIPLLPIGPFFYLVFVRRQYFVKKGVVYRGSRKYITFMTLIFGISSLLAIIIRGILPELQN